MTTELGVGGSGDDPWDDGNGGKDVQLDDNDLFDECLPPENEEEEDPPPSEGKNGDVTKDFPHVRHSILY